MPKAAISLSRKCLLFGLDWIGVARSVPEPSTALLVVSGSFRLSGYGRKKFSKTVGLVGRNENRSKVEAKTKEITKRRRDRLWETNLFPESY